MRINITQRVHHEDHADHQNCSSIFPCRCDNTFNSTSETPPPGEEEVEIEAFFYIVVVIVFYATSIVLLLVKYARNDDEEKHLKYQYSEFVKRERFQAPRYKNKLALERTKALLHSLEANGGLVFNCPVITISNYAENSETELCTVSGLLGDTLHDGSLERKDGARKDVGGAYSIESALERPMSLCTLSYDTGLGLFCPDNAPEHDCEQLDSKKSFRYEKSHSI